MGAPFVSNIVYDGERYAIKFRYLDGIGPALRGHFRAFFAGNDWKGTSIWKSWVFPAISLEESVEQLCEALQELAERNGEREYRADPGLLRMFLESAREDADPGMLFRDIRFTIRRIEKGGVAVVGPYLKEAVAVIRAMNGAWSSQSSAWVSRAASPFMMRDNLLAALPVEEEQVVVADGYFDVVEDSRSSGDRPTVRVDGAPSPAGDGADSEEDEEEAGVVVAATEALREVPLPANLDEVLASFNLYAYQRDGVVHILSHTATLLADDMGLGKSRQAIAASHIRAGEGQVLIVCPASLIINWMREIRAVLPDATISTQGYDPDCRWVITNYERLPDMVPHSTKFSAVNFDEAHYLKEYSSQRTQLAFEVAGQIPFRLLLTGTPVLNTEREMHTLLRLSGHPLGNIAVKEFEKAYGGNPELRRVLSAQLATWMLRRRKKDVLLQLKGKTEQRLYVELDPQMRALYESIRGNQTDCALAKITRLRQALEFGKIPHVLDAIDKTSFEDKVLVFCNFKDTVQRIVAALEAKGIGVACVTGDETLARRMKAVDAFQNDSEVKVFVGTTDSCGVGLNLTAANYVIFAGLPWTPGKKEQAEDRANRNGNERHVFVIILLVEGTVDDDLVNLLEHKQGVADDIVETKEVA